MTLNLLKAYGINQFKFDGTGSPNKVTQGSLFDSDFAAAIALISDLRAIKPRSIHQPDDRDLAIALLAAHGDLAAALELPEGQPFSWNSTPAFAAENAGASNAREIRTGTPITVELKPFEVLVWDLAPTASVD